LRAFGADGSMVRTELSVSRCQPGGQLEGTIEVTAGEYPIKVGYVAFTLLANGLDFHTCQVVEGFSLGAGDRRLFDVIYGVPWESPLTMPGVEISLLTELELARAVDRSDQDPVGIDPLPAQQRILEALTSLGFHLIESNVERGRLVGLPQTLDFYQEIAFSPGKPYSHRLNRLEVTFVATREKLHVVVEADRRVHPLAERDVFGRFAVDAASLDQTRWPALLDEWLSAI
jgi:sporulation-control protein